MTHFPRHVRWVAALAATLLSAACSTPQPAPLHLNRPVVLLGEVHDNAAQHALRLAAWRELLATGARPVLAMEQFDREQQAAIDRLLAQSLRVDADALVAAVGATGWNWTYYKPFIALALDNGLPIVAASLSRNESRAVMRDGLARSGFDAAVPADILAAQAGDIEAGHCGMLDAATAQRMALAQVARDQWMARVLQAHAGRGVVLLAGNGHVRTDVGVPRWLPAAVRGRSVAIGMLETGSDDTAYDVRVYTAPQERPDPCAAMRKPGVAGTP
jgi:uncharacterized iron-regulated protein